MAALGRRMATVEAQNLRKSFGTVHAVDGINLTIREGEFVALLGPSGCGKTTLLRMIAGLERPTSGDILIGGAVVTDLPARARKIAMVFQSYALYPQRLPREQIAMKISWASALLGIEALLDRKPRQLSGGQRQRVALARAL